MSGEVQVDIPIPATWVPGQTLRFAWGGQTYDVVPPADSVCGSKLRVAVPAISTPEKSSVRAKKATKPKQKLPTPKTEPTPPTAAVGKTRFRRTKAELAQGLTIEQAKARRLANAGAGAQKTKACASAKDTPSKKKAKPDQPLKTVEKVKTEATVKTGTDAPAAAAQEFTAITTPDRRSGQRAKAFRSFASAKVEDRIARACNQRMFLISGAKSASHQPETPSMDFFVVGSTGNVYTVQVGALQTCSCPDAGKGNLCKHVLFVMLKVLGEPSTSPIVWQKALTASERTNLFARYAHRRARTGVDAAAAVRAAFERQRSGGSDGGAEAEEQGIKQRPIGEDSDCVICFDPLKGHGAIVWCKTGCGHSLHKACIDAWSRQKRAERNQVTCPYCRADWPETAAGGSSNVAGVTANEGYVNVAQVTGQSTYRPEYHSSGWGYGGGWRKGYRRWRRRW